MKFQVWISQEAKRAIRENVVWWATNHSPPQAASWNDRVFVQLEELRDVAAQCARSREDGREQFPFPLYDRLLGLGRGNSHRAVFTIRDDAVFILTVRSNRQDELHQAEIETNLDSDSFDSL